MNIAVLLKQVPAVSDIQLAADNNLVRVGAPSMLNPVAVSYTHLTLPTTRHV